MILHVNCSQSTDPVYGEKFFYKHAKDCPRPQDIYPSDAPKVCKSCLEATHTIAQWEKKMGLNGCPCLCHSVVAM